MISKKMQDAFNGQINADEVLQKLKLAGGAKSALFMMDKEMAGRTFAPGTTEGD